MYRRSRALVAVLALFIGAPEISALPEPPAPAALDRPDTYGDQLVYYYDARPGFTTFLTVRSLAPGDVTVRVDFYGPGLDTEPVSRSFTVPAGGLHVLDVGSLTTSSLATTDTSANGIGRHVGALAALLPAQAGVAFASVVDESGVSLVSGALSGNFTVANLATGSAFGAPAAARSARTPEGATLPLGTGIDNSGVSLQPIRPSGLELAGYYNPDDLAPAADGGNQLIFINFEDVIGLPLRARVGATDWTIDAARSDGSVIANTGFTATGVVVTDLAGVLGAGVAGSGGNVRFSSFVSPPRQSRFIFFAEALGTFGTGYMLPSFPALL